MTQPSSLMVNLNDIPWETYPSEGKYGGDDRIVANHVPQKELDLAITRLMPGKTSCPYHFHHVGEELFVVLEGSGLVRLPSGTHRVKPHDVISCPAGPEGAHQFINDTDAPLVYMAISNEVQVEVCEYPDSGKALSVVLKDGKPVHRHCTRLADQVPYFHGELGEEGEAK